MGKIYLERGTGRGARAVIVAENLKEMGLDEVGSKQCPGDSIKPLPLPCPLDLTALTPPLFLKHFFISFQTPEHQTGRAVSPALTTRGTDWLLSFAVAQKEGV